MQKRCRIISLVVFLLVEFMMPISYASEDSEEDFSLEENIEAATSEEESNSEGDGSSEAIDENLGEETEDETVEDEIKEEKEEIKESVEDVEEKDSVETDVNIEGGNDEEPEEGDGENLELEDEEKVEDESDVENDENKGDKDLEETGTGDEEISGTGNRETLESGDSEALETGDLDDEKGDTNDNVEGDNEPKEDEHGTAELDDGIEKNEEENSEGDENLEFESLESSIDVVAMLLGEPLMAMAPVTFVNYEDNVTTYKVTFIANPADFIGGKFADGTTEKTINYQLMTGGYYQGPEEIQIPNLEGNYMFEGWYTNALLTPESRWTGLNASTTYTAITLYAKYLPFEEKTQTWDGVTFTIMDRNLGATDYVSGYSYGADNGPVSVRGNYYQWGNNYGFENQGNVAASSTDLVVNNSSFPRGPGNYYFNGTFIRRSDTPPYRWDDADDRNLWGGKGESADKANPDSDKQGPCPEGYHVPSTYEWLASRNLFQKWQATEEGMAYCNSIHATNVGSCMLAALGMPFAGRRNNSSSSVNSQGTYAYYWSSTAYSANNAYHLYADSSTLNPQNGYNRAYAFSLRCFRDSGSLTLTFDSNGGSEVESQTGFKRWNPRDIAPTNPTKENVTFDGWYTDKELTQPFSFSNTTYISEDITLYAKWNKPRCQNQGTQYSGVVWNCEEGTITVTNGGQSITMKDMNVGATEVGYGASASTGSYGLYYQWGGITPYAYDLTSDQAKRAGFVINNDEWSNTTANIIDWGQGPCDNGYHVPTSGEWQEVLTMYTAEENSISTFYEAFKIPFAGYRGYSNVGMNDARQSARVWLASPEGDKFSDALYIVNGNANVGRQHRAYAVPVRCFKDAQAHTVIFDSKGGTEVESIEIEENSTIPQPINPTKEGYAFSGWYLSGTDELWNFTTDEVTSDITLYAKWNKPRCQNQGTQYSGVVWNCEKGTITVTNGSQSITMKDMNVGATEVGYGAGASTGSYGLYYQWGGITGYDNYLTPEEVIEYGFIMDSDAWSETVKNIENWGQGPCSNGYHIPTETERQELIDMYTSNGNGLDSIYDAFKIPFAGGRRWSTAISYNEGIAANLWSASPYEEDMAYRMYIQNGSVSLLYSVYAYAYSVRCFKDINTQTYVVSFDSQGGTDVESEEIEEGNLIIQPENPEKSGFIFSGWYILGTDTLWNFGTDTVTGNMILYAKRQINEPVFMIIPNLIEFPSVSVQRSDKIIDVQLDGYFGVKDPIGSESGWRITIEATDLSGSLSVIDKSNIYLKAGALETVGELNEAVHINQNLIDDFVSLGTPINYIYKTTTTNHKTGEYRDKPTLKVKVPAYQSADTYSGKIVVTLYEN